MKGAGQPLALVEFFGVQGDYTTTKGHLPAPCLDCAKPTGVMALRVGTSVTVYCCPKCYKKHRGIEGNDYLSE